MAKRRHKRKVVSEINVVPYIDVMLVLLIIFMVTAPLLNVGVDIELPQTNAKPVEQQDEPLLVSINREGGLFLTTGGKRRALTREQLAAEVATLINGNPKLAVRLGADQGIDYGLVFETMTLLQNSGVKRVGLIGEPGQNANAGR
jgi:biopolymer transport protein TolR